MSHEILCDHCNLVLPEDKMQRWRLCRGEEKGMLYGYWPKESFDFCSLRCVSAWSSTDAAYMEWKREHPSIVVVFDEPQKPKPRNKRFGRRL